MGAGCGDWFSSGDVHVYRLVNHFDRRLHTIASISSRTECAADQAYHLTSSLNRE
jgi:hypothetical protein